MGSWHAIFNTAADSFTFHQILVCISIVLSVFLP